MVAEHVQPTPGSQTALNQQLGIRDSPSAGRDYQAMGITRVSTGCWSTVRSCVYSVEMHRACNLLWQGLSGHGHHQGEYLSLAYSL